MLILKLAIRPWRLSPWSQIFSVITLSILLIILISLVWFSNQLSPIAQHLASDQVVTAYLDSYEHNVVPEDHGQKIVDQIQVQLGSSVREIKYVHSKEFLAELEKRYFDLTREIRSLGEDVSQIVPEYISIRGPLSSNELEWIRQIPGIESMTTSQERFQPILSSIHTLQWVLWSFQAAILVGLLSVLFLLSRVNDGIYAQTKKLLVQLGGSPFQAKIPQLIHQAVLGLMAGGCAVFAWSLFQKVWIERIQHFSPYFDSLKASSSTQFLWIVILGVCCGLFSGWIHLRNREN